MPKYSDMAEQFAKERGYGASAVIVEAFGSWLDGNADQLPDPEPEPTNAEKLAIYLGLHDLDAITQAGVADFARQLDADGVKAPEANHEIH